MIPELEKSKILQRWFHDDGKEYFAVNPVKAQQVCKTSIDCSFASTSSPVEVEKCIRGTRKELRVEKHD